jgi:putative ABC transport system permease protein
MILKIAWRNIWRSKVRSLVVITSVALGVWAVIFLISFSSGMVNSYINNTIQNEISHIQIHDPSFPEEKDIQYSLPQPEKILKGVRETAGVKSASLRTISTGMLSSSKGARGVMISGIDPVAERDVTHLDKNIVEGDYLDVDRRNPILISKDMAEKMNVRLRSKMVLTFQNLDGDITAGAFRIAGLFDTGNNAFDEFRVFVRKDDLSRLIGDTTMSHELAMLLDNPSLLDTTMTTLESSYPDLLVQSYKEISPETELFESQIQLSATIFTFIVMLALIFGIINTMLMAVLERYKELGMLMSIGMNKVRVFLMIMAETIMLGILSAPLGLLIGYLTVRWLNNVGINLSLYSEGMQEFGMSDIVYPELQSHFYWQLAIAVLITSLLASIYPALKAIRLKPVEAIRKI